jgi:hypothetical protein
MFWKPREERKHRLPREPQDKGNSASLRCAVGLLDALRAMDPCDWRGEHDAWRDLMNACKAEGIACEDFVAWSIGDPVYRADGQSIRREWKSLRAQHGGALWAALKARGIKVNGKGNAAGPSLYPEGPLVAKARTRNLQHRTSGLLDWLGREPSEQRLFNVACVFGEIVDEGRMKVGVAAKLLEGACRGNGLCKLLGADGVRRTIANGLRHVEEKVLAEEEC